MGKLYTNQMKTAPKGLLHWRVVISFHGQRIEFETTDLRLEIFIPEAQKRFSAIG